MFAGQGLTVDGAALVGRGGDGLWSCGVYANNDIEVKNGAALSGEAAESAPESTGLRSDTGTLRVDAGAVSVNGLRQTASAAPRVAARGGTAAVLLPGGAPALATGLEVLAATAYTGAGMAREGVAFNSGSFLYTLNGQTARYVQVSVAPSESLPVSSSEAAASSSYVAASSSVAASASRGSGSAGGASAPAASAAAAAGGAPVTGDGAPPWGLLAGLAGLGALLALLLKKRAV